MKSNLTIIKRLGNCAKFLFFFGLQNTQLHECQKIQYFLKDLFLPKGNQILNIVAET